MYDYDILTGLALTPDATYGFGSFITPEDQNRINNTLNDIESTTDLDFQQVDYNTAEIKISIVGLNYAAVQDSVVSEVIDLNSLYLFPTAFDLWAIETNYLVSQI